MKAAQFPCQWTSALLLALAAWTSPLQAVEGEKLALDVLAEGEALGSLRVEARLVLDDPEADGGPATVELRWRFPAAAASGIVTLLLDRYDDVASVLTQEVDLSDVGGSKSFLFRSRLEVPDDYRDAAVVLQVGELWGGAIAELAEEGFEGDSGPVRQADLRSPSPAAPAAPLPPPQRSSVLRILAPAGAALSGRQRFQVLAGSPALARVVYELDGFQVGEARRPPYSLRIDLGVETRTHTVTAIGYDGADRRLGEDTVEVNGGGRSFRAKITRLEPAEGGFLDAEAEITVPLGSTLEVVEFYLSQTLVERLTEPPFRARIPAEGRSGTDYVQVLARLTDGSSIDDVRLLAAPGGIEEVEVNLVEVYAVVTDKEGIPQLDLEQADFLVTLDRKPQTIQRFGKADVQPLSLGVVIDTSGSMDTLMHDTRRAAARFLQAAIREGDRAFLVDFDTQPRLAHPLTGDLFALIQTLGSFQAGGYTAMNDAVAFSTIELDGAEGRKALVLLTDGDDYQSKVPARKAISQARQSGVPVYVIAMGALDGLRRDLKKIDVEALALGTGGRVFYIDQLEQLAAAYASIVAELRGQYLMAFARDRELSAEELSDVGVEVRARGLKTRFVVGRRGGS